MVFVSQSALHDNGGALRQTTLGCPCKRKRDGQGCTRGTIPKNTRRGLRISGAVLQLPYTPLWRTQPQLHRFFFATVEKSK
jgi:hypothetical protein